MITPPFSPPDDDDIPEIEGVFDLTARRSNAELRQKVDDLTVRLAEANLQARDMANRQPTLDHAFSRGEHGKKSTCKYHPSVIVDETKREVRCRYCEESVDAFVVLLEFAKKERHLFNQLEWRRDEMKKLNLELADLKKNRASLRAQVNAAKKRLIQLRAMGAAEG